MNTSGEVIECEEVVILKAKIFSYKNTPIYPHNSPMYGPMDSLWTFTFFHSSAFWEHARAGLTVTEHVEAWGVSAKPPRLMAEPVPFCSHILVVPVLIRN